MKVYLVKEAANELRTSETVVRNLISNGKLKSMKMPTTVIPDFELKRFMRQAVRSQEDYTEYAKFIPKKQMQNKLVQMR